MPALLAPTGRPQVYLEFIHRAMAGLVMIGTTIFSYKIFKAPTVSRGIKWAAVFSWVLVIVQAIMGGLTVLMQLHDKIVTIHLGLGTGFFALLLYIYLSLKRQSKNTLQEYVEPPGVRVWAVALVSAVYGQILLGGLVATNYAANVCPEFPLCHGKFVPTFSGVIGLQVIHRLGAYTLTALVLAFFIYVHVAKLSTFWRAQARLLAALVLVQVCIGISNVLLGTPPLIAVLHLFTGTVLLGVATRMLFAGFNNRIAEVSPAYGA
jgi:heme a synthase